MADKILTQDYLQSIFDYKDGELFWKKTSSTKIKIGDQVSNISKVGYRRVNLLGKTYQVHRLIFFMFKGYFPNLIDHIDGNRLNNKIENLRHSSQLQNCQNTKIKITNTSGCKNVSWNKSRKKWRVSLTVNYKHKYIGEFDYLELADLVATEAREKYFGKFARHH